ncbi:PucR family transcriptional regulator [Catenulispora yoronensis]
MRLGARLGARPHHPLHLAGRPVAADLRALAPDLSRRVLARLLEELPVYAALPGEEMTGDIAAIVQHSVRMFADTVEARRIPADADLAEQRQSAQQRAEEGVPLDAILAAYQLGIAMVWSQVSTGVGPADHAALREVLDLLLGLQRRILCAVTESYLAARRVIDSEEHNGRHALMAALLSGTEPDGTVAVAPRYAVLTLALEGVGEEDPAGAGGTAKTVSASGLSAGRASAGGISASATSASSASANNVMASGLPVGAVPAGSGSASGISFSGISSSGVAARRAARRVREVLDTFADQPCLTAFHSDRGTALIPLDDCADPDHARLQVLVADAALAAGVQVTAAVAVAESADVPAAATRTGEIVDLVLATGRPPGLYRLADVLLDYQLSRPSPALSALAARLEPLASKPELLATLETYLALGRDRRATAAALHVHPNTIDYRLRRVSELTGLSAHRAEDLGDLHASLVARQVLPDRP